MERRNVGLGMGYPFGSDFHDDRLASGGLEEPLMVWMSRPGDYYNHERAFLWWRVMRLQDGLFHAQMEGLMHRYQ